ncbi:MarR family transcriptional regulator [Haloarcula onubensis]|nr:MarR family transcriptional regulator [Halomicroarcula sp. S3CR25-11]
MVKRYSGDWMVLADDRILEYLYEEERGAPTDMVKSGFVRYSNSYVSQRLKKLESHGLVQNLGRGLYTITDRGKKYLNGELNTSEDAPDEVNTQMDSGPSAGENHEQA